MIFNYIKIAWRNMLRQKLFSLINISGLAIGLAVCMLIMLYVAHEHSYDRFHKNAKQIVALHETLKLGDNLVNFSNSSYVTGPELKQAVPGVSGYLRIYTPYQDMVVNAAALGISNLHESKMLFADKNFFSFFSFKLIRGTADQVLNSPFNLVISAGAAKKYFGDHDPLGKVLSIRNEAGKTYLYHVTGVAENAPSNSSIGFEFLASGSSLDGMKELNLKSSQVVGDGPFKTYLLLAPNADTAQVRRSIQPLLGKDKYTANERMALNALTDIHLKMHFGDGSNVKYLQIFPFVAILVLLLALVNYMSLSTARSTLRAKEIGVRKVAGASRKSLAAQFYIESALYILMAFVLAYVLSYGLKNWFLGKLQLTIDNQFFYSPQVILLLAGLLILTILCAGTYPAIVLSSFKPIAILKGKFSKQTGGAGIRKIFTILQFSISTALIICGLVIDRQLYFIRHTDTGLNRENVVMVPVTVNIGDNYQAFRKDISSLYGVAQVATAHYAMYKGYDMIEATGRTPKDNISLAELSVDENFFSVLGIRWKQKPSLVKLLFYNKERKINQLVINEAAAEKLGLPASASGSMIRSGSETYEVGGVVKNFNFGSLQSPVKPLGIAVQPETMRGWGGAGGYLFVKIKPHVNLPSLMSSVQDIFKKYDRDTPFQYTFMDDAFNQQYKAEDRLASIFSIFTGITILLAGMGLFGLAAFTIEQRTKEIGVRKILGASLSSIASLLSVDFLKLVLLSVLIASPFAWWAMHKWLQNFAYRIPIQWWMFASAGLLAVIIAIITISYHALKAAVANPVDSLRSE